MRVHLCNRKVSRPSPAGEGLAGKRRSQKKLPFSVLVPNFRGYEIHENIRGAVIWVKIMQTTNLKWKDFLLHAQKKASIPYFSTFPRWLYPPRIIQVMWHSPSRPLCPQVHQSSLSLHLRVPHPPHMKCTRHTAWDQEKEHWKHSCWFRTQMFDVYTPENWLKEDGCTTTFLGGLHLFTRELLPSRRVFLSMVGKVGYNTVAIPVLSEFQNTDILSVDFPGVSACRSAKTSPVVQYGS